MIDAINKADEDILPFLRIKLFIKLTEMFSELEKYELCTRRKKHLQIDDIYTIGYCIVKQSIENCRLKSIIKLIPNTVNNENNIEDASMDTDTLHVYDMKIMFEEMQVMRSLMTDLRQQNNKILTELAELKTENVSLKDMISNTVEKSDIHVQGNVINAKKRNIIKPADPISIDGALVPDSTRVLLYGDRSVTNIRSTQRDFKISSDVKSDLSDVHQKLCNMSSDSAKKIIIATGVNDCLSKKDTDQIGQDFRIVLKEATRVSLDPVKVSSVCVRSEVSGIQSKINKVNDHISQICENLECEFVDNSLNFTFRDGSIDYSLYNNAKCDLSQKGTNRLMLNLGLSEMTAEKTQNKSVPGRQAYNQVVSYGRHNSKRNLSGVNSHEHRGMVDDLPRHRNDQRRCHNCGERGHLKNSCRHTQPIYCDSCGLRGHKSKHCAYT